mgnify:CR=1 FL=1
MSERNLHRDALRVLDTLIDLPLSEQVTRVARLRSEDPELAPLVERMLNADVDTGPLDARLETGLMATPRSTLEERQSREEEVLRPGTRLGRYTLVRKLGRGGMGDVYLGEHQTQGLSLPAAIKLLRRGLDSEDFLRRFRQEQRILADLNHPSIARLLDSGISVDGRPYYAMEYIDGQSLTDWCRVKELSVRARVRLLAEVAEAVAYAQARLVVHRDLKPSNILIDGDGKPHLLDFGIAKMLEDDHAETQTQADQRMLSPAYAAPEQFGEGAISTATDVYALGAVLFELLTGVLPHGRPVRERAGSQTGASTTSPAQALKRADEASLRRIYGATQDVRRERRDVDRDLDTIVRKALRQEPERRYTGAATLAEDLRRWLAGRAIQARPDTAWYQLSLFMRRHRIGVALGVVGVASLIGLTSFALWQAERAHRAAERAERTKQVLLSMYERADPFQTDGQTVLSAVQLVEATARHIDENLGDTPGELAELRIALSSALVRLGARDSAREVIDRTVADLRSAGREYQSFLAKALLQQALSMSAHAPPDEVIAINQEALKLMDVSPGDWRRDRISAYTNLIRNWNIQGRYRDALRVAEEVLDLRRSLVGSEHADLAMDLHNLALTHAYLEEWSVGANYSEQSLAMLRKLLGDEHPRLIVVRTGLAYSLTYLGRYREAAAEYDWIDAMQARTLGPSHAQRATTLLGRANLHVEQGQYAEAEQLLLQAHLLLADADSAQLAGVEFHLGRIWVRQGRLQEAERMLGKAVERTARFRGLHSAMADAARASLALARAKLGSPAENRVVMEALLANLRKVQDGAGLRLFEALGEYTEILTLVDDRAALAAARNERLALAERLFGPTHPRTAALRAAVARSGT